MVEWIICQLSHEHKKAQKDTQEFGLAQRSDFGCPLYFFTNTCELVCLTKNRWGRTWDLYFFLFSPVRQYCCTNTQSDFKGLE